MITSERLEHLKHVDLKTAAKDTLVDIRSVRIDESAPLTQQAQQFIEQVRNPYLFRVGDSAVKLSFGNGRQMTSALKDYLISLRAGY